MIYSTDVSNARRIEQLKADTVFTFIKNKYGLSNKTLKNGLIADAVYSIYIIVNSKTYHPNTIKNAVRAYFSLKGEKAISNNDLKYFILENTNSDIENIEIIQVCKHYEDFSDNILAYSDILEIYNTHNHNL